MSWEVKSSLSSCYCHRWRTISFNTSRCGTQGRGLALDLACRLMVGLDLRGLFQHNHSVFLYWSGLGSPETQNGLQICRHILKNKNEINNNFWIFPQTNTAPSLPLPPPLTSCVLVYVKASQSTDLTCDRSVGRVLPFLCRVFGSLGLKRLY